MSFTVFLGNLPVWVTADDIKGWLSAENLVADAIKVIRNPETQESKGFAFIEAPNNEEMNSIIRRFDRAPLEDRLLRANPAQPPKPKGQGRPGDRPERGFHGGGQAGPGHHAAPHAAAPTQSAATPPAAAATGAPAAEQRPPRRGKRSAAGAKRASNGPQSAFAEELAKAL
ncbi:MAG TPA: RNA-binding protein [Bryobacteraceae bacterium]|nr:RNA-binding protein [Bryobacteraceae bacterium]